MLDVAHLCKSYGSLQAVQDVSFRIESGEVFGLLGPNGAGKSSTINILATLLDADRGEIRIETTAWSRAPAYKKLIGYVPQDVSLAEKLTARENLTFIGRLYNLTGSTLKQRVDQVLAEVGLSDRANDLVSKFSGGMKRRLNIAGALLHDPKLVLLDEPTAGVDPHARAYIFGIVERLAAEGKAVLYTTHYMEEAQRLCKRTAIIDRGRVLAIGTAAELMKSVDVAHEVVLVADGLNPDRAAALAAKLGGPRHRIDAGAIYLTIGSDGPMLARTVVAAEELGIRPRSVSIHQPNLETIFLKLTGRALRD